MGQRSIDNSASDTAVSSGGRAYTVVQISDCHLGSEPGEALLGMDADHSLASVVSLLQHEQAHIDLLVVSGDMAADASTQAYRRLFPLLNGVAERMVWLPGNHDDIDTLRQIVASDVLANRVDLGGWQLLMLDSAVPDQVGGQLRGDQLALLADLEPGRPAVVFLHHHLQPIGCQWLDEQRVSNADAFFSQLPDCVKAVICGHVHQASENEHRGVSLLTTPSTCIQFKPGSEDFALDDLSPGYRWLRLHPGGELETGVSRVSGVEFQVDYAANGYQ